MRMFHLTTSEDNHPFKIKTKPFGNGWLFLFCDMHKHMGPFHSIVAITYKYYRIIEGDKSEKPNWFGLMMGYFVLMVFLGLNLATFTQVKSTEVLVYSMILGGSASLLRSTYYRSIHVDPIIKLKRLSSSDLVVTTIYCSLTIIAFAFRSQIQELI